MEKVKIKEVIGTKTETINFAGILYELIFSTSGVIKRQYLTGINNGCYNYLCCRNKLMD